MTSKPFFEADHLLRAATPFTRTDGSELSDPPSGLDDYDFDLGANFSHMTIKSPLSAKAIRMGNSESTPSSLKHPRPDDNEEDSDCSASHSDSSDNDIKTSPLPGRKKFKFCKTHYSPLELVPNEILNKIAFYVEDDRDFISLASSCSTLSRSLIPPESAVWKKRFLSLYDYPLVERQEEYAFAYQARRFVLSQFVAFTKPDDERLKIQMIVLKDMVVETYLPSQKHLPAPLTSRNLAAFESPQNSPWMHTFLSTALYPSDRRNKFGQAHPLFDALQVCLSHLLLSPASKMAHAVDSSRTNYSLLRVYNWNQMFNTLYRRVEHPKEDRKRPASWLRQKKFPKLRDRNPATPRSQFKLDMHALLHIRNFWHRHVIDDTRGFSQPASHWIGENTYAKMVKSLCEMGITPRKWDLPLNSEHFPIPSEWYGHYSCLHPWPKTVRDMEERQTCAEDWTSVDPLKLEFSTSQDNLADGFWPPIFSCIPAFDSTIPNVDDPSNKCTVIQGLANFVDLDAIRDRKALGGFHPTLTVPKLPKYHPFLSLRLRGVIHPIESQPTKRQWDQSGADGEEEEDVSIPGWNRIVMVMYKPTKRYLIQVLEYAEENYGDAFGPLVSMQLSLNSGTGVNGPQTAQPTPGSISSSNVQNNTNAGVNPSTTPPSTSSPTTSNTNTHNTPQQQAGPQPTAPSAPAFDAAEAERQLQAHLEEKLLSNKAWRSSSPRTSMTRATIEAMEDRFRSNYALDWNDMEYAYAYEGAILPGGKIALGRWWRCGLHGVGPGKELDAEGFPVDVVGGDDAAAAAAAAAGGSVGDGDGDGNGNGNGNGGRDGEDGQDTGADGKPDGDGANAAQQQQHADLLGDHSNQGLERGPFVFWC